MFHPLKLTFMEKDFLAIAKLVKALNALNGSISSAPRFVVEIKDRSCFVYGLGVDLALIYSLVWAHAADFCVYFARNDKGNYVEFYRM